LTTLYRSTEDLKYLDGRRAEVSIADLFDHARRRRVDTVFFGAAEVDVQGRTNMSVVGELQKPKVKLPGVVGASSLRRWVKRPVLLIMKHSKRSLVNAVQVVSTQDPGRRTTLITDLGVFEVGTSGAQLTARHPWASEALIAEKTGFAYSTRAELPVTELPSDDTVRAIRSIDSHNLRQSLVG
jgi:glutaconate CoA-transferase subunit B